MIPRSTLCSQPSTYFTLITHICSFVFYKWERKRPTMICPTCETTKYDDGISQCSCGGQFEMMEVMKHVA